MLEGAMNGETFRAYFEQVLAPTLRRGDIVFMDNVPVHKVAGVQEAIEGRGAILVYLPAYSPDFKRIEQFFAKLKAVLRKLAAYTLKGAAYSIESLCKTYARLSLLALTKSLVLNVLPISLTQDINLTENALDAYTRTGNPFSCPVFICSASTPASDCRRADHCYGPPEIPVMKKLRALNKLQVDDLPRRVF